jgi:hypothetical protein
MPETPLGCKAIMPNKHDLMKKNCRLPQKAEIKLRHGVTLFPFVSFSRDGVSSDQGAD